MGKLQAELGAQQAELGKKQAELGRQQQQASRKAGAEIRQLLDAAIKDGKAKQTP